MSALFIGGADSVIGFLTYHKGVGDN